MKVFKELKLGSFLMQQSKIIKRYIMNNLFNIIVTYWFNRWSVIVAIIGSCVLLYIVNKLRGNVSTKEYVSF
jgi:uncharacterized membrane protein YeaQ/YmgE (transglycosylase-associated protein family)